MWHLRRKTRVMSLHARQFSASSQTACARNRIWFPLVQGGMERRPSMFSKWLCSKKNPGLRRKREKRKWVVKVISEETISGNLSRIMTQSTDLKGLRDPRRIIVSNYILTHHSKLQKVEDNKKLLKAHKWGNTD